MKASVLCTSLLLSVVSASTDSLYGYGVGIGGLPFIYADGQSSLSKLF